MYGLSLTANLLCASATRRFASATRRARSSDTDGGVPVAGGAGLGVEAAAADAALDAPFFIAAILAAISAFFCAMRTSADSYEAILLLLVVF